MKCNGILGANFGKGMVFGLVIFCCVLTSGCQKSPDVILVSSVKSPDGRWVAEAKTEQWSGPGNNYVATTVALRWAPRSRRPPIQVLELSNESAYPIGATSVKMEWVTNSHLDVVYGAEARVNFQATKAGGLDISAHAANK